MLPERLGMNRNPAYETKDDVKDDVVLGETWDSAGSVDHLDYRAGGSKIALTEVELTA
jgi:hypothetical protein